uniref:non-specific serine/threonine protein kinase n=1 Tax=Parascaris equorum TaxID=6256 RepID=A0A914RJ67_PAREQ
LKLREVQKHELLPKHPNLVEFIRAWEERGRLYIQTELCEYSLSDYAEREHNIPEEQLWYYFSDLVAAVNHLHSHHLLHLDIKPENIFISRDQVCKLGDFGLIFDLNKIFAGVFAEDDEVDPISTQFVLFSVANLFWWIVLVNDFASFVSMLVTQYMMEKLTWFYMCMLNALQFLLWPVMKPLSYFRGVPITPRGRSDSPRTAAFYKVILDEHEMYESTGGGCDSYAAEREGGDTVRPQRRLFDMADDSSTTSPSVSSPISSRCAS